MQQIPGRLLELVEGGEMRMAPGAFREGPWRPMGLEETFLLRGPGLFDWICSRFPRRLDLEHAAGVSHATLSRWTNSAVGQGFGQGRNREVAAHHSIWWGYPMPLPGLDRICEEIFDFEDSLVGRLVAAHGFPSALHVLRSPSGFGLADVGVERGDALAAAAQLGIQPRLARRWMEGRLYPTQWTAMDRVCEGLFGCSWLEAILFLRPPGRTLETPPLAMRLLVRQGLS